jgi:hypothetical protein
VSLRTASQVWTFFKAQNDRAKDTLSIGMVNNMADVYMTSGNSVLKFEAVKCWRKSEIYISFLWRYNPNLSLGLPP